MYIFLDAVTFRYRGAPAPVLDRLSLFIRSGEIAAVVGPAGAGKTTLLRYVGRRSDGRGRVFLGSQADESGRKPGLIRGWRFSMGDDHFPPKWRSERWRGVWIRRYAFPNMALDGSDREPPGGWSEEADNVFYSIYSRDGRARDIGWKGAAPIDPDRQDLLLVDDLSTKPRFGNAADRRAFIRDLHALHPRPRRRTVIYATRDPADALEVANRIAVLRRGRCVSTSSRRGFASSRRLTERRTRTPTPSASCGQLGRSVSTASCPSANNTSDGPSQSTSPTTRRNGRIRDVAIRSCDWLPSRRPWDASGGDCGSAAYSTTTRERHEASADEWDSTGMYVTVRNFRTYDDKPEWHGTTLFLDGLDGSRAGMQDGRSTRRQRGGNARP